MVKEIYIWGKLKGECWVGEKENAGDSWIQVGPVVLLLFLASCVPVPTRLFTHKPLPTSQASNQTSSIQNGEKEKRIEREREREREERERERERGNILGKTANRHELQREEEEEESKSNRHVIRLTEPTIFADAAARTLLCRVPQHVSGRLNITATNLCCFATQ
jgi:hypothetical protein